MTTEEYRAALRELGLAADPWGVRVQKLLGLRPRILRYMWNGERLVSPRTAYFVNLYLKNGIPED